MRRGKHCRSRSKQSSGPYVLPRGSYRLPDGDFAVPSVHVDQDGRKHHSLAIMRAEPDYHALARAFIALAKQEFCGRAGQRAETSRSR